MITYTIAEIEAEIVAIRLKIKEIRGLPTKGKVGETFLDMSKTLEALYKEEQRWLAELAKANSGSGGHPMRVLY